MRAGPVKGKAPGELARPLYGSEHDGTLRDPEQSIYMPYSTI
jgi:hypothetical protein